MDSMEEFYNNPFKNNCEVDDICFAPFFSQMSESITEPTPVQTCVTTPCADAQARAPSCQEASETESYSQTSTQRLQHKLNETMRASTAACDMYTNHIETQRQEIDRLDEENNELQMKVAWLESQMRAIGLEKDCAAMAYKREVEKNAALEAKITSLKRELSSMEERARQLAATYSRGVPQSTYDVAPYQNAPPHEHQPNKQQHTQQQLQQQQLHSGHHQETPRMQTQRPPSQPRQPPSLSPSSRGVVEDVRGGIGAYPGQRKNEQLVIAVKDLESNLQRACQRKDELENHLRRVETTRIRSGAERAKKIALERELADVQKQVSDIRMKLRSLSALER
ncbi:uncharacterized protein TEOVI_000677900 [Trypanosoma equiperdum]|uniref:Uncharacterized protein n=1 Tax=Trypanosoma equiperdum TaxID=5694 RepID=A0A1G4I7A0_TRYEQ|nr:hypothetical protein, conserved [Trypanosoma equiperdum]